MIDTNFHSWCIFQPANLSKPPKDKHIIQNCVQHWFFACMQKGMTTPTWRRSPKICQGLQWTILFDSACLGCRFYMLFGIDCYITTKKKIHMESDLKFEVLHLQGIPGTNKNPSFRKLPVNSCLGSGWVGFFGWSQDRLENMHLVCRDTTSTENFKRGGLWSWSRLP